MTSIPLKKTGKFELPMLGFGTLLMGGRYERDPDNDDQRDINAMKVAIDSGLKLIDTAEMYAGGRTEELIGQAITSYERKTLFITSKVLRQHLAYDDVIRAAKNSLQRLQTSYLDLYLIHHPNPDIPMAETMRAMDYLLENEIIHNIGVSNFDVALLKEAQSQTKNKIVNNQIHYSLCARAYEENGTLEYCRDNDILVSAYRPIGLGMRSALPEKGIAVLKTIGDKYNKNPYQVALNWVIHQPNVIALVKTTDPQHLKHNIDCVAWQLSAEDNKYLQDNFPRESTINLLGDYPKDIPTK